MRHNYLYFYQGIDKDKLQRNTIQRYHLILSIYNILGVPTYL